MLKRKSIAVLLILPFLLGFGKSQQKIIPGAYLSKAEAKVAIENASPQDGMIIPNQSVIIHWSTRLSSAGYVKYRKINTSKWKIVKSPLDTMHSIQLDKLKPGDQLEYVIVINLKDGPFAGDVRSFSVAQGGLVFLERNYVFNVKRDYQQHCAIKIANNDDKSHSLKATVFNPYRDFIVGFVGEGSIDKTIEIAAGEKRTLELVAHAQDTKKEEYPFIINLETLAGKVMKDSAQVLVKVEQVDFNVQVELGEVDPVTLGTVIKIRNLGGGLTDFSIKPGKELWGKVKFLPEVNHALLKSNAYLKIQVLPRLEIGRRELAGEIVISAAGKKQTVPIKFVVPKGKQVFCAVTQSIYQSSAATHFCTNRENVDLELNTPGDGPEVGHIRNTPIKYHEGAEKEKLNSSWSPPNDPNIISEKYWNKLSPKQQKQLHYHRHNYETGIPFSEKDIDPEYWTSLGETPTHNIGTSGNKDYRGKDKFLGLQAIYDSSGKLISTPENSGGYDFISPLEDKTGHFNVDVLPWIEYGNSSKDTTTRQQRIAALEEIPGMSIYLKIRGIK